MSETPQKSTSPTAKPKAARNGTVDRASLQMLQLYRTNLEVRLRCVDEQALKTDMQRRIYAEIAETQKAWSAPAQYDRDVDWDEAYKVERLMAALLDGPRLRQEITARLQDFASDSASDAAHMQSEYQSLIKGPAGGQAQVDDATLHAFLLRLLEALHWAEKKKYLARPIRKVATKILLGGVATGLFLMILPYVAVNFDPWTKGQLNPLWSLFALWTALMSGLVGALFTRLITLQSHWAQMPLDEVFLHRELSYTVLRAGVGMCGALIVFFFLRSGLMSGELFPDFDKIAMVTITAAADHPALAMYFVVPSSELALLTIWCFIAGFSEALVPGILSKAERQLSGTGQQAAKSGR
jgi:hypothetical protein